MTCDIFLKSYQKDFQWIRYCLKSIHKYCRGFNDIVIVVPETDLAEIKSWNLTREKVFGEDESQNHDSYIVQQKIKLHADTYCRSEYVLYCDSDCCFFQECTPENFFVDGKPYLMITPFTSLGPEVDIWKKTTTKALKYEPEFETMRRIPILFPTFVLDAFRHHMIALHGMTLEAYLDEQPKGEFSEFNALGNYCLKYHREKFFIWDTSKEPGLPVKVANQEWSHGKIDGLMKAKLQRITA